MLDKRLIGDVNGNNNQIINGDGSIEIHVHDQLPDPQDSIMGSLLMNIAKLVAHQQVKPKMPKYVEYDIMVKIDFNLITIYRDDYDHYDDGAYIIEQKFEAMEEYNKSLIRPSIYRYVKSIYLKTKRRNRSASADEIIDLVEDAIRDDLVAFCGNKISPDDLSHIAFVVFYVFAACKIFDIPSEEFLSSRLLSC